MRFVLLAVFMGLLASVAAAAVIDVPNSELDIFTIQDGMNEASAGDTVLIAPGVYDSMNYFTTDLGVRTAICRLPDGVTMRGVNRDDVVIDQGEAEYGILMFDVGPSTAVKNLTITGGGRISGPAYDADGRGLLAGICCLDNASPLIRNVNIFGGATGIICRTDCAPTIEQTVIARGTHHGLYIQDNGASPVTIDALTIVGNFDSGIYVNRANVDVSNTCVTHSGKEGIYSFSSTITIQNCNVYLNDSESSEPANYGGELDDLTGEYDNISAEPFYCDFTGTQGYDYHVCVDSPNLGAGIGGVDIGAFGGGCEDCIDSPVNETTWGSIKAMYR